MKFELYKSLESQTISYLFQKIAHEMYPYTTPCLDNQTHKETFFPLTVSNSKHTQNEFKKIYNAIFFIYATLEKTVELFLLRRR